MPVSITRNGYVDYTANITVTKGSNADNFTMQPNELTGTVTSSYDGSIVPGAGVTIAGLSGSTGTDGVYTIYTVPVGNSQAVTATQFGFNNYLGNTTILEGSNNYSFEMMTDPGTLRVRSPLRREDLLPGVNVTIAGVSGYTNSNGIYMIPGVPSGANKTVTGQISNYENYTGTVSVGSDATADYNFTMIHYNVTVTGTVLSSTGGNVGAGALVAVGTAGGHRFKRQLYPDECYSREHDRDGISARVCKLHGQCSRHE